MAIYDTLTADEPQEESEYAPKRGANRGSSSTQGGHRHQQTHRPKNQRPADVSVRVWGMAQHWVDLGTAALGRRPKVNLEEFSKRLSSTIHNDPEFRKILADKDRWGYVDDLLVRMIEMFWEDLDGTGRSASQWTFLDDQWDDLRYDAATSLRVRYLKEHGRAVPPPVYDPEQRKPYEEAIKRAKIARFTREALENADAPFPRADRKEVLNRWRNRKSDTIPNRDDESGNHHGA